MACIIKTAEINQRLSHNLGSDCANKQQEDQIRLAQNSSQQTSVVPSRYRAPPRTVLDSFLFARALHTKLIFPPIYIEHNQCPCDAS